MSHGDTKNVIPAACPGLRSGAGSQSRINVQDDVTPAKAGAGPRIESGVTGVSWFPAKPGLV